MDSQGPSGDEVSVGTDAPPIARNRYDWSETPPSLAIVQSLSEVENDPLDVTTSTSKTLSDYVDPDALDALYETQNRELPSTVVTIEAYDVSISGQEIAVYEVGPDDSSG